MQRILLPFDGSPAAAAVFPRILTWLQKCEAKVVVLRVVDLQSAGSAAFPTDGVVAANILADMEKEARRSIDDAVAELAALGVEATGETAVGRPVSEIVDGAERLGVDAICLSTHGRTGLARWAFGSVTEKVLRRSPVPVVVLPSFRKVDGERVPDKRLLEPRHVLFPVDGSDFGQDVAPVAAEFAKLFGADVTVVHVVPPGLGEIPRPLASYYLEAARTLITGAGVVAETVLREGDAASEILALAGREGIGLVAMGTHGRTGWERLTVGSVAERVLREAPCPAVVVRSPERH